jgi:hypothetical protein
LNLIRVMPAKGQDADVQTSIIIARLIGPLFSVIGIGMLINTETYRQIGQQFLSTYAIIYLSGIIILLMGLMILNVHNRWTRDWRSAITAVGYILTIAGCWRLIAPQFVPFVGGAILGNSNFFVGCGAVLVTLGGFLTYKGYVAPIEAETQPNRMRAQGDAS